MQCPESGGNLWEVAGGGLPNGLETGNPLPPSRQEVPVLFRGRVISMAGLAARPPAGRVEKEMIRGAARSGAIHRGHECQKNFAPGSFIGAIRRAGRCWTWGIFEEIQGPVSGYPGRL